LAVLVHLCRHQLGRTLSSEREGRKRSRIQKQETRLQEEAEDLMAESEAFALALAGVERHEERRPAGVARWWVSRREKCSERGYDIKTHRKHAAA
jgi:hypothetical protein